MLTDTVYREHSNGRWHYWVYADGQGVYITEAYAKTLVARGSRLVEAKS